MPNISNVPFDITVQKRVEGILYDITKTNRVDAEALIKYIAYE